MSAAFSGTGKLEGQYWPYQSFQKRTGGTSASGAYVTGRDPFRWVGVEVRGSQNSNAGAVKGLRPLPDMSAFSMGVVISGFGQQEGGNATDSIGLGVEYVYQPVVVGQESTTAMPPPPPTARPGCYQLVGIITCADDIKKDYCQASQRLDFIRQPDNSIVGTYRGGTTRDSCKVHVLPQQGLFALTCPSGSGEWRWDLPPQTWCPDQDGTLNVSAAFSGTGHLAGEYGSYQAFQNRPGGTSASGAYVTGRDPFNWLEVDAENSQAKNAGGVNGLRPLPDMDRFSLAVVVSGFGRQHGGNATDSVGFGVEYVYQPIRGSRQGPPNP